MDWHAWEGRKIAEELALGTLLRVDGASAFFTEATADGAVWTVRLTEADEPRAAELLEHWCAIAQVHSAHLPRLGRCGRVDRDGSTVVYLAIEPNDGNLAEILDTRSLGVDEAREVAQALIEALLDLHAHRLFHGAVTPGNVLAVGETVKLRSDCVDPMPKNPESDVELLRAADVHGLASTLLQALTQSPKLPLMASSLPAPFDRIIPHGLDGSWSLSSMQAALLGAEDAHADEEEPARADSPAAEPTEEENKSSISQRRLWIGLAAVLAVVIAAVLLATHGRTGAGGRTSAIDSSPAPAVETLPPLPAGAPPRARLDARSGWFVVAAEYPRAQEALAAAAAMVPVHPDLKPQFYTPTGYAPYFVVLGGSMSEADAEKLWIRARQDGVKGDLYIGRNAARR